MDVSDDADRLQTLLIVPIPPMLSGSWSVLCWMMVCR